jgi:hypothetical protein
MRAIITASNVIIVKRRADGKKRAKHQTTKMSTNERKSVAIEIEIDDDGDDPRDYIV